MSDKDLPFPEMEAKSMVMFKDNITKSEIQEKAVNTVEAVNEGHVNSIDVFTQVRAVKEVADAILDGIKETVIDDVERLHADEREYRGIKLELANGRTKYDFSHDEEWVNLQEELSEIKDRIKSREKLMIDAIKYSGVVDKDTGEEIQPAKIIGGTPKSVKVIIPK